MDSEGDGPEERQLPFLTTGNQTELRLQTQPLWLANFLPTYKLKAKKNSIMQSFSARGPATGKQRVCLGT